MSGFKYMENVLYENLASQETSFSSHEQMITVPHQRKSALADETHYPLATRP